jgi:hypothetical protein
MEPLRRPDDKEDLVAELQRLFGHETAREMMRVVEVEGAGEP